MNVSLSLFLSPSVFIPWSEILSISVCLALFFREGQSSAVSDVVNLPGGLLGVDTNAWVQEGAIRDAGGGEEKGKEGSGRGKRGNRGLIITHI